MTIHRTPLAGDHIEIAFSLTGTEDRGEGEESVSVVGSFNDWTPGAHPLTTDGEGARSVTVSVPAGTVVYFRYLATGGRWFDDPDADETTPEGGILRVSDEPLAATTAAPQAHATPAPDAADSTISAATDGPAAAATSAAGLDALKGHGAPLG